ncbi:MAG: sulfatase-like hydrolase/transferase, partial [Planctomycetaceae bacterium]|nr:sulfatase-like hydrolase/transferase [Planctomycetaceae bacterium]
VDRQIGRVLNSLDELDLAEDTIVVVWGDHGWHLGESAIWGKHSPFDRSLNSVLMIRVPGVSKPNHQCDELVESTDLYPTLMAACRLETTETAFPLDGFSLLPLLQGGEQPLREAALSMFGKGFTLRSKTHRLIGKNKDLWTSEHGEAKAGPMEFYNLTKTIDPVANVIDSEPDALDKFKAEWPRKKIQK